MFLELMHTRPMTHEELLQLLSLLLVALATGGACYSFGVAIKDRSWSHVVSGLACLLVVYLFFATSN